MKQSNYVTKNLELKPFEMLEKLATEGKLANYSRVPNGRMDKLKEVFFDTKDKTLLFNGGFCRLVTYTEDAYNVGAYPTRYFLDYKKDDASKINRMEVYSIDIKVDMTAKEIKKLLNIEEDIIPMLELSSNENRFYLQYVDLQLMFEDVGACIDFVVSATTIESYEEIPVYDKVVIFSLQDVTAKRFNKETVKGLKDKINTAYKGYDKVMQSYGLTPSTKNKYQIIAELLGVDLNDKKKV